MALQVLIESRGLARLMIAFCEVGCVAGGVGIQAGRELEIAVLFVEVRGDRNVARDDSIDRCPAWAWTASSAIPASRSRVRHV